MPLYIDINRCIGCRTCEAACQMEHGGRGRINVQYVEDLVAVPIFCHHCEEAFCATVCFTGALHKEGETTAFDAEKCTGWQDNGSLEKVQRGVRSMREDVPSRGYYPGALG